MHRFLVVIEKAGKNYSAYSPDLLGCIATGRTWQETEQRMHEAIELHVRGLIEDGLSVPKPHASASFVTVQ
jgi:predicted RNase H-like HicB family nuclease